MSGIDQRSAVQVLEDAIVKRRVLNGIGLLQEQFGGDWAEMIDLDTLNLSDSRSCVLGQLFDGANVSDEQAAAWHDSKLGRAWSIPRERAADFLNGLDGYQRGIAILDGPLTSDIDGPERFGFNEQQLWVENLECMTDEELADLGVTRTQVQAALAHLTKSGSGDEWDSFVGPDFGALDDEWRKEIRARR